MRVSQVMNPNPTAVGVDASLDEAMLVMENGDIRHLPVVRNAAVVGVLSDRDLLEATGWLNRREREVLEAPAGPVGDYMHSPPVTVGPDDSLTKCVLRMAGRKIGCLPVVEDGVLVGILTELDVLAVFASMHDEGRIPDSSDPPVSAYMTPDLVTASPDMSAEELIELMHSAQVRHLPVVEEGVLVGIVSDRDIRKGVGQGTLDEAAAREFMIEKPFTVGDGERMSEAAKVMIAAKVGAVPVVRSDGTLCGIVALPDLFAACLDAFEAVVIPETSP